MAAVILVDHIVVWSICNSPGKKFLCISKSYKMLEICHFTDLYTNAFDIPVAKLDVEAVNMALCNHI